MADIFDKIEPDYQAGQQQKDVFDAVAVAERPPIRTEQSAKDIVQIASERGTGLIEAEHHYDVQKLAEYAQTIDELDHPLTIGQIVSQGIKRSGKVYYNEMERFIEGMAAKEGTTPMMSGTMPIANFPGAQKAITQSIEAEPLRQEIKKSIRDTMGIFAIRPASGVKDIAIDSVAGLTAFVTQLGAMTALNPTMPAFMRWEMINQYNEGTPGAGAAMWAIFGASNVAGRAVASNVVSKAGKTAIRMATPAATMGGVTAGSELATTGKINPKNIMVQTFIGAALGGIEIYKGRLSNPEVLAEKIAKNIPDMKAKDTEIIVQKAETQTSPDKTNAQNQIDVATSIVSDIQKVKNGETLTPPAPQPVEVWGAKNKVVTLDEYNAIKARRLEKPPVSHVVSETPEKMTIVPSVAPSGAQTLETGGKEVARPQIDTTKLPKDAQIKTVNFKARELSPEGSPFGLPAAPAFDRVEITLPTFNREAVDYLESKGFTKAWGEQKWLGPDMPIAEPSPPPAEKQSWEMTKKEYVKDEAAEYELLRPLLKEGRQKQLKGVGAKEFSEIESTQRKFFKAGLKIQYKVEQHQKLVQQALSEGKPVPRAVLEEYKNAGWMKEYLKRNLPPAEAKAEKQAWEMDSKELSNWGYENKNSISKSDDAFIQKLAYNNKGGGPIIANDTEIARLQKISQRITKANTFDIPFNQFYKDMGGYKYVTEGGNPELQYLLNAKDAQEKGKVLSPQVIEDVAKVAARISGNDNRITDVKKWADEALAKPAEIPAKGLNTRAIGELNKEILNNEAYKNATEGLYGIGRSVGLDPRNPKRIDPRDWGEIRDEIEGNDYLRKCFVRGVRDDPGNFSIDNWANNNFVREHTDIEDVSGKIGGEETTPDSTLFAKAIRASYELKEGDTGRVNEVVLRKALNSGHPEAISLEWSVRKRDMIRQRFTKEEIDFAEKEFYNAKEAEYAYGTTKTEGAPTPETARQDYEQLERQAIQSEEVASDAEVTEFLAELEKPKGLFGQQISPPLTTGTTGEMFKKEDYLAQPPDIEGQQFLSPSHQRMRGSTILFDPQEYADALKIGAFHLEAGARKFIDWSEKMISDFGKDIEPQLPAIWNEVSKKEVAREGKLTPSRLSERVEELAIEKKLAENLGDLAGYEKTPEFMKNQAKMSIATMDKDWTQAKKMAMGQIPVEPAELKPANLYKSVAHRAAIKGDIETLRDLATQSTIPSLLSEYGREIKAADVYNTIDPVKAMQDVIKTRERIVMDRSGIKDLKPERQRIARTIKEEMRKSSSKREDWESFILSIQC